MNKTIEQHGENSWDKTSWDNVRKQREAQKPLKTAWDKTSWNKTVEYGTMIENSVKRRKEHHAFLMAYKPTLACTVFEGLAQIQCGSRSWILDATLQQGHQGSSRAKFQGGYGVVLLGGDSNHEPQLCQLFLETAAQAIASDHELQVAMTRAMSVPEEERQSQPDRQREKDKEKHNHTGSSRAKFQGEGQGETQPYR